MSLQPLLNPTIPYVGVIDGGLTPGKLLRIQGFVPQNGQRFNINFQTGGDGTPKDDVSLHISVRLAEGYVARNSYEGGTWGTEDGNGQLPIFPGQKFEIIILCEEKQYKIAINGRHYCEFPQRISHAKVTHLGVDGDVQIGLIVFEVMSDVRNNASVPLQNETLPAGFEPNAPPQSGPQQQQQGGGGGFGPPPQQQQSGFVPYQPGYGPPPPQQGGYGPPFQQGGGYGPPPPPPGTQGKEESGLEGFLESASTALMGAIGSGAADKLIGLISGPSNNNNPQQQQQQQNPYFNQQQQQQQPQQPNQSFHPSQVGGQGSVGGLGSVGSLLTSFAEDLLSGKKNQHH